MGQALSRDSFRVLIHDKSKAVQVSFQSAKANQKPMVLVTLLEREVPVDRKVIPIDIYEATMTLQLYDLKKFCKKWLMPCLEFRRLRQDNSLQLHVSEAMIKSLIEKCEQKRVSAGTSIKASELLQPSSTPILRSIASAKSEQQPSSGILELIKRSQVISGKQYDLEAAFNFNQRAICFKASREGTCLRPLQISHTPCNPTVLY